MNQEKEKKQLIIFLIIAYAVTFIMGFIMKIGKDNGMDISVFPNVQMMYPAAGVMLAYLLTKEKGDLLPKGFYITFVAATGIMLVLAVLSAFIPVQSEFWETLGVSFWAMLCQYVVMVGSIVLWIILLLTKKEKREAGGLRLHNAKWSLICVALFLVLYTARYAILLLLAGEADMLVSVFSSLQTWFTIAFMPLDFFLVFIPFFGEEYGWRYYLQPILQKKFGLRGGVLLLGVVWGLWHMPLDFWYYSDKGVTMTLSQIITCVALGIFFAFAYMKTQNIWVPVIMHFLNNNLIVVFSGNYSSDILENQTVRWVDLPLQLLVCGICFGLFIFAKPFRKPEDMKVD